MRVGSLGTASAEIQLTAHDEENSGAAARAEAVYHQYFLQVGTAKLASRDSEGLKIVKDGLRLIFKPKVIVGIEGLFV